VQSDSAKGKPEKPFKIEFSPSGEWHSETKLESKSKENQEAKD
jgi:hypothetical protein